MISPLHSSRFFTRSLKVTFAEFTSVTVCQAPRPSIVGNSAPAGWMPRWMLSHSGKLVMKFVPGITVRIRWSM